MLTLSLLGSFEIYADERPHPQLTAQKAQALLIYLAVEARQSHQRDTLITLFWPDYPQKSAQQSLRQSLYLLRQAMEPDKPDRPLILSERFTVALNPEAVLAVDVVQFEELSGAGRSPQDWQKAAELYRGHFLADFYLPDSEPFEEWAANKRAFYQRRMEELLQRLADYYVQMGDYAAAEMAVRRQLSLDNLQEAAHRQLMGILAQSGRRQEALTHYHSLRQLLQDELGIEPDSDTISLVAAIETGDLTGKIATTTHQPISRYKQKQPGHNLPYPIRSFIGREKEMSHVTDLVKNNRLVMLTGTGGIGKTTLTIQVGNRLLETFPDGVWLVELAPVVDEMLVTQTILHALGLWESSNRSALDTLLEFLREKESLLILDNCEHLIRTIGQLVQSVLQGCAKIKILANSREILDLPGESLFYVPPLSLPDDHQLPALEQWPQYEAIRLFVERATAVHPEFRVTQDNLTPLVQICRRLDGIPLALELAAARVKMLTAEQIAGRLDQRFSLLTTGNRSALPRHQTLHALVDWSWELLSQTEQVLLSRLSVFAGGMTLEAVEAICPGDGVHEYEVLEILTQLVNKSLVIVERPQEEEIRYHLLETIRQYAWERLVEAGGEGQWRQRHLEYFYQLAEEAEKALVGPDQVAWMNRLEGESDNLRAALNWARQNDVEVGLQLSTALWRFWVDRGYIREQQKRLSQLLAHPNEVAPAIKAKAILRQGQLHMFAFNLDQARTLAEQSLTLYQELGDQEGIASALFLLGIVTSHFDSTLAREVLLESLVIYRALDDKLGIATALLDLARIEVFWPKNYEQAAAYLEESESLFRELGHLNDIAAVLETSGLAAIYSGEYQSALPLLEEALAIWELFGPTKMSAILDTLAKLNYELGDYRQAGDYLERSLLINQQAGLIIENYWIQSRLGYVYLRLGELTQARAIFTESLQNFKELDGLSIEAYSLAVVTFILEGLASLAANWNQPDKAVKLFAWADAARKTNENPRPHNEQTEVDGDISAIREMMDEEAYAAAYAEGNRMTREEAIALALGVGGGETAV